MKKVSTLICFLLISAIAFSQWTWQNPLPQGNCLCAVCFTDANIGYTKGDSENFLKTIDGGTSWIALSHGTMTMCIKRTN